MRFRYQLVAVAALSLFACQSVHTQEAPAPAAAGQPVAAPPAQPAVPPAPAAPAAAAPAAPAATAAAAAPTPKPHYSYSLIHGVGRTIAMTFDDGPSPELTPKLLDILKARGIHATFFVIGQNAALYPDILKREAAEGHEIGNHSWSHPQLTHLTADGVDQQVTKTNAAIKAAIGHDPVLIRPPYGATSIALDKHFAQTYGLKVVLWEVDPLDWKIRNSAHVEHEILAQTIPGSIILSHDIHATTVAAMPDTLDALIAKGYKFVTVSQLIAMEGTQPDPTPVPKKSAKPAKSGSGKAETQPATDSAPPVPVVPATEGKAAQ